MADWKNATCEKCRFRVDGECRRFPPVIEVEVDAADSTSYTSYPVVKWDQNDYMPACAEYQTEGEKTSQVVRDACKALFDTPIPASGVLANAIFEDSIENHRAKRDATGWDVPPIRELK